MLLFEHFRTAHQSLRRTRMRTLLTVTGVAIGIASITAILALSGGITDILKRQISSAGDTVVLIRPNQKPTELIDLGNPTPVNAYSTSPFSLRDIESLSSIDGVSDVAPLMTLTGSVRSKTDRPTKSTILATTPEFINTTPVTILEGGQFIDEGSQADMAVIGEQLAVDLFGTDRVIGKRFFIRGQQFTVIGVMKRQNTPINYNNVDLDHTAVITFESGLLFNDSVPQIQQINIKAEDGDKVSAIKKAATTQLKMNHDNEVDFDVLSGKEIAAPTSRLFILINAVMAAIASISLLVGGIGIMNIMLVSVAERTREIGLRKAVGASSSSIVLQFLIEAFIIGVIGGLLGYAGGYVVAFCISLFLPYDPSLTWQIAAIAFGLSVGVGTLFGLYPAIRAARKDPIESLRRLH
jgi:putative ABC transport system permease protein